MPRFTPSDDYRQFLSKCAKSHNIPSYRITSVPGNYFRCLGVNSGKSEPTHYMHALHLMTQLEAIPQILANTKEEATRLKFERMISVLNFNIW